MLPVALPVLTPFAYSAVRLLERKENVLKVKSLDAIDGSPVIDIKPYTPMYHAAIGVKVSDWSEQIEREINYRKTLEER